MAGTEQAIINNDTGELEPVITSLMPDESKQQLAVLDDLEKGMSDMEATYADLPDTRTKEGYALADRQRKDIKATRSVVNVAFKKGKAPIIALGSFFDDKKNTLITAMEKLEKVRVDALKVADDERRLAAEEAATRELERVEFHKDALGAITNHRTSTTVDEIENSIESIKGIACDSFEEFTDNAEAAVSDTLELLTLRLNALNEQAAETARLAEQKAAQDLKDQEQADKAAALEKQQSQIDAQKTAAQKAKDDTELARVTNINNRLSKIETIHEDMAVPSDFTVLIKLLDSYADDDFQEFQEAAQEAIKTSRALLEDRRKELVRAEQAAEEKRAADAKAVLLAEEKKKADALKEKERAEAEKLAEAERLEALAPDAEKLSAWLESIPELPEVESDVAIDVCSELTELRVQMSYHIDHINKEQAA